MCVDYIEEKKKKLLECREVWERLTDIYEIDDSCVVLCLSGENRILDRAALDYLPNYVRRKNANKVEIFVLDEENTKMAQRYNYTFEVSIDCIECSDFYAIYDFFCFAFNIDNIAFTVLNRSQDNMLGRILEETDVTEEEVICLGVYKLRELQEKITYV